MSHVWQPSVWLLRLWREQASAKVSAKKEVSDKDDEGLEMQLQPQQRRR